MDVNSVVVVLKSWSAPVLTAPKMSAQVNFLLPQTVLPLRTKLLGRYCLPPQYARLLREPYIELCALCVVEKRLAIEFAS